MTSQLLLARRLLEAVVDPDTSARESDEAAIELAEVRARIGVAAGRTLSIDTFEGMEPDDLSPFAWLYLLENQAKDGPEVPIDILESLFLEYGDSVIRFRLVSGSLSQPRTRAHYADAAHSVSGDGGISGLPDSFPKRRIVALQALADEDRLEGGSTAAQQALLEMVLYLLQDGSEASLALAAGAITPEDDWRRSARSLVENALRTIDPGRQAFGRAFRNVRFDGLG